MTAGQTLATLDAAFLLDARNGLQAAEAALGEARASEAVAALQVKRGLEQLIFGGVAQAEVERRQVDLAKAQAAVKSAQANAEMYRSQYQRLAPAEGAAPGTSAVVTPIAGVVTSVGITLGEVVDTGRDAFTVADPTRVVVLANLYGADISRVKAGNAVSVESPARPSALRGPYPFGQRRPRSGDEHGSGADRARQPAGSPARQPFRLGDGRG
ncbi:efflux RND transporter periplasmic adaptor subunit [Methylobacterium radiotolerans]|uniref:efflux RND transporter periplasmic adaptor subunit n=1 Tax=Methylobacterium radiotolerans TaxID=31998 RepID=UPI0002E125CB|nr:efflux RND transporter periplasmic adaptor subunit [Methylobacterium radiotolerans]GEN00838.1 hypothetical protein MRA01_53770 [Methylobacterium radiotolerans]